MAVTAFIVIDPVRLPESLLDFVELRRKITRGRQ